MNSYQVTLPNFNQIDQTDQDVIVGQMVSLFAGPLENARLLTLVMPTRYDKLEKERRQLAMSRPDEWERRGLMEEVRIISNLGDRGEVRKARHYFIDFDNTIGPGELTHWRINSTPAFPELPDGEYVEFTDHLAPIIRLEKGKWQIDESRYKCTILASYQLNRNWDWRYPFVQAIGDATGPMVICLDVRKVHPEKVARAVEFWTGMILNGYDRKACTGEHRLPE